MVVWMVVWMCLSRGGLGELMILILMGGDGGGYVLLVFGNGAKTLR